MTDADVLSPEEVAFQKLRQNPRRWRAWCAEKLDEATLRILGPEKFAEWQRQCEEARG
jgi:hypothetical protein